MTSREKILAAVKKNQPEEQPLPGLNFTAPADGVLEKFVSVLNAIGGAAHLVSGYNEVQQIIEKEYDTGKRIISLVPQLPGGMPDAGADPHSFEDVELLIISAPLAVAENAAVWITGEMIQHRVLPFITQNLAVIISRDSIVPLMQQAYEQIGDADYGFGLFIAGPSKTADIEQSLVLGAHGSRTMRVFIL
ncbi:MAG: LUD domain-containing protein [Chitinophagaceae bacterium]|nr:LUD domain-containing protein [Chitinophagaceae bacterium]MCW5926577.1 LUD domain-containing protein [Chitinophagaceae bacterium]